MDWDEQVISWEEFRRLDMILAHYDPDQQYTRRLGDMLLENDEQLLRQISANTPDTSLTSGQEHVTLGEFLLRLILSVASRIAWILWTMPAVFWILPYYHYVRLVIRSRVPGLVAALAWLVVFADHDPVAFTTRQHPQGVRWSWADLWQVWYLLAAPVLYQTVLQIPSRLGRLHARLIQAFSDAFDVEISLSDYVINCSKPTSPGSQCDVYFRQLRLEDEQQRLDYNADDPEYDWQLRTAHRRVSHRGWDMYYSSAKYRTSKARRNISSFTIMPRFEASFDKNGNRLPPISMKVRAFCDASTQTDAEESENELLNTTVVSERRDVRANRHHDDRLERRDSKEHHPPKRQGSQAAQGGWRHIMRLKKLEPDFETAHSHPHDAGQSIITVADELGHPTKDEKERSRIQDTDEPPYIASIACSEQVAQLRSTTLTTPELDRTEIGKSLAEPALDDEYKDQTSVCSEGLHEGAQERPHGEQADSRLQLQPQLPTVPESKSELEAPESIVEPVGEEYAAKEGTAVSSGAEKEATEPGIEPSAVRQLPETSDSVPQLQQDQNGDMRWTSESQAASSEATVVSGTYHNLPTPQSPRVDEAALMDVEYPTFTTWPTPCDVSATPFDPNRTPDTVILVPLQSDSSLHECSLEELALRDAPAPANVAEAEHETVMEVDMDIDMADNVPELHHHQGATHQINEAVDLASPPDNATPSIRPEDVPLPHDEFAGELEDESDFDEEETVEAQTPTEAPLPQPQPMMMRIQDTVACVSQAEDAMQVDPGGSKRDSERFEVESNGDAVMGAAPDDDNTPPSERMRDTESEDLRSQLIREKVVPTRAPMALMHSTEAAQSVPHEFDMPDFVRNDAIDPGDPIPRDGLDMSMTGCETPAWVDEQTSAHSDEHLLPGHFDDAKFTAISNGVHEIPLENPEENLDELTLPENVQSSADTNLAHENFWDVGMAFGAFGLPGSGSDLGFVSQDLNYASQLAGKIESCVGTVVSGAESEGTPHMAVAGQDYGPDFSLAQTEALAHDQQGGLSAVLGLMTAPPPADSSPSNLLRGVESTPAGPALFEQPALLTQRRQIVDDESLDSDLGEALEAELQNPADVASSRLESLASPSTNLSAGVGAGAKPHQPYTESQVRTRNDPEAGGDPASEDIASSEVETEIESLDEDGELFPRQFDLGTASDDDEDEKPIIAESIASRLRAVPIAQFAHRNQQAMIPKEEEEPPKLDDEATIAGRKKLIPSSRRPRPTPAGAASLPQKTSEEDKKAKGSGSAKGASGPGASEAPERSVSSEKPAATLEFSESETNKAEDEPLQGGDKGKTPVRTLPSQTDCEANNCRDEFREGGRKEDRVAPVMLGGLFLPGGNTVHQPKPRTPPETPSRTQSRLSSPATPLISPLTKEEKLQREKERLVRARNRKPSLFHDKNKISSSPYGTRAIGSAERDSALKASNVMNELNSMASPGGESPSLRLEGQQEGARAQGLKIVPISVVRTMMASRNVENDTQR